MVRQQTGVSRLLSGSVVLLFSGAILGLWAYAATVSDAAHAASAEVMRNREAIVRIDAEIARERALVLDQLRGIRQELRRHGERLDKLNAAMAGVLAELRREPRR